LTVGLDYCFYVQKQTPRGWGVPPGYVAPEGKTDESGFVMWLHSRANACQLFWGLFPQIPMRKGEPPGIEDTDLFREWGEAAFRDWYHSWVPLEDMLLDLWDERTVLICAEVEARFASIFETGDHPFPREQLVAAGVAEDILEEWRVGDVTDKPVDWTWAGRRHELHTTDPTRPVEVTWLTSVSDVLGESHSAAFRNLRRYGRDDELRIICTYS
jgi:hypothetical protein